MRGEVRMYSVPDIYGALLLQTHYQLSILLIISSLLKNYFAFVF